MQIMHTRRLSLQCRCKNRDAIKINRAAIDETSRWTAQSAKAKTGNILLGNFPKTWKVFFNLHQFMPPQHTTTTPAPAAPRTPPLHVCKSFFEKRIPHRPQPPPPPSSSQIFTTTSVWAKTPCHCHRSHHHGKGAVYHGGGKKGERKKFYQRSNNIENHFHLFGGTE